MPGGVVGTSMLRGYAGTVAREGDAPVIRQRPIKAAAADVPFGSPVKIDTGCYVLMGAGSAAADFAGVAVREVKQAATFPASGFDYKAGQPCDAIQRGSVMVKCNVGTPAADGTVYVRITANGGIPAGVVGGFEASADGGNVVTLTNAKWGGAADANGIAELVILTRLHP